jgi:hypothetical protein
MFRLIGSILGVVVICTCLVRQSVAGEPHTRSLAVGWELERDVKAPSYALTEPASTDLNIDSIVLSCEQGPSRRGLQLRLYLWGDGSLGPRGAGKDLRVAPTVDLVVDGVSYSAQLLFADDFVVVADTADGATPLLSDTLLDILQAGRKMELRFRLVKVTHGQPLGFDGIAVVDLQAGPGGAAVAAVRRCADEHSA